MKFSLKRSSVSQGGMALVVTLSAVVLLTILVLAFFSRAILNRQISFSSTSMVKTDSLARSAGDLIVGELREEIRAGSTVSTVASGGKSLRIYQPNAAKDMVTIRDSSGDTNRVRISSVTPPNAGGAIASGIASSAKSQNGRSVTPFRWNRIRLADQPADPSWILLTRGGVPSSGVPPIADASDPTKNDYVIGRYAYAIYDEGGLLNVNAAGAPGVLSSAEQESKGSVALADLSVLPDGAKLVQLVEGWRDTPVAASGTSYLQYAFGTFDAQGREVTPGVVSGGYLSVRDGHNTFLNRQDLIEYAQLASVGIGDATLKSLGTFGYELNSPSVAANAAASSATNPAFSQLMVAGQPIGRFPLNDFRLLDRNPASLSAAEKAKIKALFGLEPDPLASDTYRAWIYPSRSWATAGTIGTPQDAIDNGSQPDLFELAKAAILNGSLGVNESKSTNVGNVTIKEVVGTGWNAGAGGTTYTPETDVHLQVARLIANMIDQTDRDDYPTTITLASLDNHQVYGIEDLPYFSELKVKGYFPDGTAMQVTAGAFVGIVFELWNPHKADPSHTYDGPVNLRIVVNDGAQYLIRYRQETGNASGDWRGVNWVTTYPSQYRVSGGGIPLTRNDNGGWREPADVATRLDFPGPEFPAGPGFTYINWLTYSTIFALQYQDATGQWRTYATFAGHFEPAGETGIQQGGYLNNPTYGDANPAAAGLMLPKPDPRTARFRTGTTWEQSPNAPMENGVLSQKIEGLYPAHFGSGNVAAGTVYNNTGSVQVQDYDGVARGADGSLGQNPMLAGAASRPILLNRPFRSVGELGFVFRDAPWKTLNFFGPQGGDAGLMDLFSLEKSDVIAGRTSLNTARPEVIQALTAGVSKNPHTGTRISSVEAATLADAVIAESQIATITPEPFTNIADLSKHLEDILSGGTLGNAKLDRESLVRALSTGTQTRSWNLLVDIVVQSGRYPRGATSLDAFQVEGETHYWVHLSLDRFTGKVLKSQWEGVRE